MRIRHTAGDWLRRIVQARSGQVGLFGFSLLEAAFVPIPFETVLAPYMQMRRDIMWRLAAIGVAGYLTVAVIGYFLGALFYETMATPLLESFGWRDTFEETRELLAAGGFLAMAFLVALPIPTLIVHIGAGTVGMPLEYIVGSVLIVRGGRYFGTGLLVHLYGDRVVGWLRARARGRVP